MRAAGLLCLVAAGVTAAGCGPSASSNYSMSATIACLRSHGYTVSRPYSFRWTGTADLTVHVTRYVPGHSADEILSFASSVAKARADSKSTLYGLVIRRNVVFDTTVSGLLLPGDTQIIACLRS